MELKIELAELQKRKLFVATPMYGGMCAGMYTRSISDLAAICAKYQIQLQLYFLFNESLIKILVRVRLAKSVPGANILASITSKKPSIELSFLQCWLYM